MSTRELIALGTGSQVPTRERNHNACVLRWDGEGFLFDAGEGTQRQLTLADVPSCAIHHICISHFHGDHCLGLPGVIQRLSLDGCGHPVHLHYPANGQPYVERLMQASAFKPDLNLILNPLEPASTGLIRAHHGDSYTVSAHTLDHTVTCLGFRLEELPGRRFLPERLEAAGIRGPMVGELQRTGEILVEKRRVSLHEVSVPRPAAVFAYVMDTRPCAGADALASGADLLLMEATYTAEHRDLAANHGHSTAEDAATTALRAGAHALALTHFSQRYADTDQHLREARALFPETVALNDLDRIAIPRRRD